jgi:hypothetical protein
MPDREGPKIRAATKRTMDTNDPSTYVLNVNI